MLFPDDLLPLTLPTGVTYLPNYVTREAEQQLISAVEAGPWDQSYARRRKQYGKLYDGGTGAPLLMPGWLIRLMVRMVSDGVLPYRPEHALVNEYLPGQGIADHVDRADAPGGRVLSLSLGSGAQMRFTEPAGRRHVIYLEPRSVVMFQGAARDSWSHGIPGRLSDPHHGLSVPRERRISITVRCGL